ncbi:redoxin domain-containing protein [Ferruginibacter sp.]
MIKKAAIVIAFFCFAIAAEAQQIPILKMADVVKNFSNKNDTVYVINFWATFCKPCVAEIPGFIKITDKYKNQKVKLLLVSLDLPSFYPKKIASFAAKNNFKTNIAWLDETDADYFCPMIDEKWSGAIPATIIVNTKKGYKKFFEAELNGEEFEMELKKAMEEVKKDAAVNKFISPMNDAKIIEHNKKVMDADFLSYGVTFKAKDSTVYSINEGVVGNCLIFENSQVVIIEQQGFSYFYNNLKNTLVKNGDIVKKDQVIGFAATEFNESLYTLNFNLFKRSKQFQITKDDFVMRSSNSKDHSFDPVNEPE